MDYANGYASSKVSLGRSLTTFDVHDGLFEQKTLPLCSILLGDASCRGPDSYGLNPIFLHSAEFIGRQNACMSNQASLAQALTNSKILQRLQSLAKIRLHPICIRIDLFRANPADLT